MAHARGRMGETSTCYELTLSLMTDDGDASLSLSRTTDKELINTLCGACEERVARVMC